MLFSSIIFLFNGALRLLSKGMCGIVPISGDLFSPGDSISVDVAVGVFSAQELGLVGVRGCWLCWSEACVGAAAERLESLITACQRRL